MSKECNFGFVFVFPAEEILLFTSNIGDILLIGVSPSRDFGLELAGPRILDVGDIFLEVFVLL